MRTDINVSLADAGQVQVSGSVHRASSANELPLNLQAEWRGAPLGQVTRMFLAHDLGWRGDTSLTAHITGVPTALGIRSLPQPADFHRESFEPAHPLNLHVTCTATYRHAIGSIDGIHCISPVGNGGLALSGAMQQIHTPDPQPDLKLIVKHVPADEVLELLRHTRGRLNNDITLSGSIDGELAYARQPLPVTPRIADSGYHTIAAGYLLATDLLLRGDGMEQLLPDLRFTVQSPPPPAASRAAIPQPGHLRSSRRHYLRSHWPSPRARHGSTSADPSRCVVNARLTRQHYQLHYSGSALLEHLLPLAHAFNIVPAAFQGLQGNGTADYNLTVQGDWLLPLMVDPQLRSPTSMAPSACTTPTSSPPTSLSPSILPQPRRQYRPPSALERRHCHPGHHALHRKPAHAAALHRRLRAPLRSHRRNRQFRRAGGLASRRG